MRSKEKNRPRLNLSLSTQRRELHQTLGKEDAIRLSTGSQGRLIYFFALNCSAKNGIRARAGAGCQLLSFELNEAFNLKLRLCSGTIFSFDTSRIMPKVRAFIEPYWPLKRKTTFEYLRAFKKAHGILLNLGSKGWRSLILSEPNFGLGLSGSGSGPFQL